MAVIDSFFSNFDHHLSFLRELPGIKAYGNSNFTASNARDEVQNIFYDLNLACHVFMPDRGNKLH